MDLLGKYSDKYTHIPEDDITENQVLDNKKIKIRHDASSDSDEELITTKSRKIEEDCHRGEKSGEPLEVDVKVASKSQNPVHTRRKPKRHGKKGARVE